MRLILTPEELRLFEPGTPAERELTEKECQGLCMALLFGYLIGDGAPEADRETASRLFKRLTGGEQV